MATMAAPAIDIREAIIREVRENERQPMDLLLQLSRSGYTDSEIKRAISELIQEGAIELTSHRLIRIHAEPAA
jgi:hypothetical protein